MDKRVHISSIFSGDTDRAIYITYFLGSIFPLAALAWVVHRYAIPSMHVEGPGAAGLFMLVVGTGALSLAAFAALHRLMRMAIGPKASAVHSHAAPAPVSAPAAEPASMRSNDSPESYL